MAAGNLIGGVAMQTFVLVIADRFVRGDRPLSTAAGSVVPALRRLGLGLDSWIALVVYALGIWGLVVVSA